MNQKCPGKTIYTGSFGKARTLPLGLKQVCIAQRHPDWWTPPHSPICLKYLMPPYAIWKLQGPDFARAYVECVEEKVSAEGVWELIPDHSVLLCWEPPNVFCHRRVLAEWLERELGVEIPEYGFARKDLLPAMLMPTKSAVPGSTLSRQRSFL